MYIVDCSRDLLHLTLSGFKTIFKNRAEGSRKWVICFTLVFCLSSAIDSGASSVNYLFYRLQYGVDNTDMANLNNMYNWLMFVSQVERRPTETCTYILKTSEWSSDHRGSRDERRVHVARLHHHHHRRHLQHHCPVLHCTQHQHRLPLPGLRPLDALELHHDPLPVLNHQVHGTKWGGESILSPRDTPGYFSLPYKPLHFIPLQNDVGDPSWSLQDLERLSVFPCFFLANLHPSRDEEARKIKESRRGGKRKRKCQKLIWLLNCKPKRMSRNCMMYDRRFIWTKWIKVNIIRHIDLSINHIIVSLIFHSLRHFTTPFIYIMQTNYIFNFGTFQVLQMRNGIFQFNFKASTARLGFHSTQWLTLKFPKWWALWPMSSNNASAIIFARPS